ncbi:MAG TPA: protein translocase subunit SecF [Thermoanaerobaculia bacterium]|nr:protein translocase subunit SecF [Thermoanaerobaculia bacterium]
MKRLHELNIDFIRHVPVMVALSVVLVLLALVQLVFGGRLNMGIDFAGGTQLIVRFLEKPEIDEVRSVMAAAGMGEVQIQRFGEEERNEIIIKTPLLPDRLEGSRDLVVRALESRFGSGEGRPDLNELGAATLASLLYETDPDGRLGTGEAAARDHYRAVAESVTEARGERGLFGSWEEISGVEGLSAGAVAALRERATLGPFAVVSAENVGPQIGSELRTRGILAVVLSLLGMLAYIWYRFEFRFGVGALIASAHDVIVTLGVYALLGYEFNLTTIAAFLTLVGYSVNDTVVIFDRVRENMRRPRRGPLADVINGSLNETLSRTVMTSVTTMLAVLALFLVGGDVLRGFSFVLLFGVVIGTYSTIYIASAMVLLWEKRFGANHSGTAAMKAKAARVRS